MKLSWKTLESTLIRFIGQVKWFPHTTKKDSFCEPKNGERKRKIFLFLLLQNNIFLFFKHFPTIIKMENEKKKKKTIKLRWRIWTLCIYIDRRVTRNFWNSRYLKKAFWTFLSRLVVFSTLNITFNSI